MRALWKEADWPVRGGGALLGRSLPRIAPCSAHSSAAPRRGGQGRLPERIRRSPPGRLDRVPRTAPPLAVLTLAPGPSPVGRREGGAPSSGGPSGGSPRARRAAPRPHGAGARVGCTSGSGSLRRAGSIACPGLRRHWRSGPSPRVRARLAAARAGRPRSAAPPGPSNWPASSAVRFGPPGRGVTRRPRTGYRREAGDDPVVKRTVEDCRRESRGFAGVGPTRGFSRRGRERPSGSPPPRRSASSESQLGVPPGGSRRARPGLAQGSVASSASNWVLRNR